MKSLCLGVACVMMMATACFGQFPRLISYQGSMVDGQTGVPVNGSYPVRVGYYSSSSGSVAIAFEQFNAVSFTNGIFDIILGSQFSPFGTGFPESMNFNQQYWIQVTFAPGLTIETAFPRQMLLSAPYALNAERVGGFPVVATPINGDTALFPISIVNGKIDPQLLPTPAAAIQQINTVGPDANNTVQFLGGTGVTIDNDAVNHIITINAADWSGGTGATQLATGTTAQRPTTPVQGMVRFNTTTGKFEGFDGTNWVDLN
jgi:hypothetical protein